MTDTAARSPSAAPRLPDHVRLDYLDGIRGLSALYVLFHHVLLEVRWRGGGAGVPAAPLRAMGFLDYGHYAVDMFIVLSGYCLMLPVVQSASGSLRGGIRGYLARRARRILPPYYAALAISMILLVLAFWIGGPDAPDRARLAVDIGPGSVLSHLLLVHNLSEQWAWRIDGPMWSVATEWQIYFIFALCLLPLWRRAGNAAVIAFGLAAGLGLHWASGGHLSGAAPWYIGLFAMGMSAAAISYWGSRANERLRSGLPWGVVSGCAWLSFVLLALLRPGWFHGNRWAADTVMGLASMALLVYCTEHLRAGGEPRSPVVRLFGSRIAVFLGSFSYSLYLLQYQLLPVCHLLLFRTHVSPMLRMSVMVLIVLPATVGCAYLFFLAIERRFLPGHLRHR